MCVIIFSSIIYLFFKPILCADNKYVQGKAWSFLIMKMHFFYCTRKIIYNINIVRLFLSLKVPSSGIYIFKVYKIIA